MAEVKAYACDICGKLVNNSYDIFNYCLYSVGEKSVYGEIKIYFDNKDIQHICNICAQGLWERKHVQVENK